MGERCPVQTSAVYLLGRAAQFPAVPPPSPPSPVIRGGTCAPIEALSLDDVEPAAGAGAAAPAAAPAPAPAAPDDVSASLLPATAPDSPDLSPCVLSPNLSSCSLASAASGTHKAAGKAVVGAAAAAASTSASATSAGRLAGAVHVLATEAAALQSVAALYATSAAAQSGFDAAVDAIVRTQTASPPGKLVVVGVGKSGHIGRKLAATFNSLAVPASFLHPTEALHGDLGHIRPHDALLFITYSGKTHELLTLLPHVDPALPLILLTAHVTAATCELVRHRNQLAAGAGAGAGAGAAATILLPAPIPVEEKVAFGVAAPTASTTTALAVGDALAIVTSHELHPSTESVFLRNHPGGAIGAAFRQTAAGHEGAGARSRGLRARAQAQAQAQAGPTLPQLAVPWDDIPVVQAAADLLRASYATAHGWVRVTGTGADDGVAPPSRLRALHPDEDDNVQPPAADAARLVVGRADFVPVPADTDLRRLAAQLRTDAAAAAVVVSLVDEHGAILGVVEQQDVLRASRLVGS